MTEQEWLASTDPASMLNYLLGRKNRGAILTWLGVGRRSSAPRSVCATDRKLRWFAVACCHRIWFLLRDERSQRAIETCERYADGMASEDELAASQAEAGAAADSMQTIPAAEYMSVALGMGQGGTGKAWSWAARAVVEATSPDAAEAATTTLSAVERVALECAVTWQ